VIEIKRKEKVQKRVCETGACFILGGMLLFLWSLMGMCFEIQSAIFMNFILVFSLVLVVVGLFLFFSMFFIDPYVSGFKTTEEKEEKIHERIKRLQELLSMDEVTLNGWGRVNAKHKDLSGPIPIFLVNVGGLRDDINKDIKMLKAELEKIEYPEEPRVYNFFEKLFTKLHLI